MDEARTAGRGLLCSAFESGLWALGLHAVLHACHTQGLSSKTELEGGKNGTLRFAKTFGRSTHHTFLMELESAFSKEKKEIRIGKTAVRFELTTDSLNGSEH